MTGNVDAADTDCSRGGKRSGPAPTLRALWLGLPVFMLTLKAFLFPLPLLDFWWHLRMGQFILDTRSIPRVDIFSFTSAGQPFIVQNWLTEIFLYITYQAGGLALLIFLNAVLLIATLLPVYHLCRTASERLWPAILSACLVASCLICNLRPQVFSFLLFAVFYWLLSEFCSRRSDRIWILPLLMIVWVNLHGAFLVGLVLVGIHLVTELMSAAMDGSLHEPFEKKRVGKLALILACCVVATLANPETYNIYSYVRTVMQVPSSQKFVVEWQPPAVTSAQGVFQFYLPFFLVTLVMMTSKRRPNLNDVALFLVFSIFGLMATRNSAWFLLVAGPILARYLSYLDLTPALFLWDRTQSIDPPHARHPETPAQPKQYPMVNLAMAVVAFGILCFQSPWLQSRFYGASLMDAQTPVGAMDYINVHPLSGHIFHPQMYGDYLIWRLWPQSLSFIDGRVHVFGEALVKDYQQIYRDSRWEDLLKKYNVRYLLLSKQEDLHDSRSIIKDARASANWKILYEDELSVLFEKVQAQPVKD